MNYQYRHFQSNFSDVSRRLPIPCVTNTIRTCDPMCQIRKISSLLLAHWVTNKADNRIPGLICTFAIVIWKGVLCWAQASLSCATVLCDHRLPFHSSSQWPRCFSLSPSGVPPELKRIKCGGVINLLTRLFCLSLSCSSVASGALAVVQCTNIVFNATSG